MLQNKNIKLKSNINILNKKLYHAVNMGELELAKDCLIKGANLHIIEHTPLSLDPEIPLIVAVNRHDFKIIDLLLEFGADINAANKRKITALHWATFSRSSAMAEFLIQRNANIEALDQDGDSPLLWSCYNENFEVAKKLLEKGANINFKGKDGITALHWAAARGNYKITKLLLEKGADTKATIKNLDMQFTPAEYALEEGYLDIFELINSYS